MNNFRKSEICLCVFLCLLLGYASENYWYEWAETWQLHVAVSKCCILNIGNAALCRPMCINGNTLHVVNTSWFGHFDFVWLVPICAYWWYSCKGSSACQCNTEVFRITWSSIVNQSIYSLCSAYTRTWLCYMVSPFKTGHCKDIQGPTTIYK